MKNTKQSKTMKNTTITQKQITKAIRKDMPPPSRAFSDKRNTKGNRNSWKKEQW
jgi:hypothetical protein